MNYFYIIFAATGGALLPLQALINSRLSSVMGGPIWASTISFGIGTIALCIFLLLGRQTAPSIENINSLPIWIWAGGLLGAIYVASTVITVKPLGAASMVSLIIFGKMISAILLDHFGILQAQSPITTTKIIGAIFLMLGVYLIVNK